MNQLDVTHFFAGADTYLRRANDARVNPVGRVELGRFFQMTGAHLDASERARFRHDMKLATGFNVFHFIEPDENRLSDVLAFLLNPREAHGQGDLFLRLMFNQLALDVDVRHSRQATVRREALTDKISNSRRRMDILIEAGALLAIENKIDSTEQMNQVSDYLNHLNHCVHKSSHRAALIYLTPNGRPPESVNQRVVVPLKESIQLHCWSYHGQLRQWLVRCHQKCAAPRIRNFLCDLMNYIEKEYQREPIPNPAIEDYES